MYNKFKYILIIIISILSCKNEPKLFTYLKPSETSINFSNTLYNTDSLNILSYLYFYNGGGVSVGDFNNDDLIDIYFTANQSEDKLYLNQGEFKFIDATEISKISNKSGWTTGSTTVDINNDGLLDIYICKVGDFQNIKGHNLLYINQGIRNGKLTFKEASADYNLDISTFSTQSVFFDYDLDGDLDMYLLNHSVHPNRNYGRGILRTKVDSLSGDRFYRNDDGKFLDVTSESNIFQGKIGYGLGVSVSDVNNDGYPDIYVGNDFFENDYLYINQKNGTFKDLISSDKTLLGHTSHFSMGNGIEDINNDGFGDIISLDMLPEDLITYKTSGLEYGFPIYENYLKNGYAPQFMQNTLHLNNGNTTFSETGYISKIAATEWSWNPLIADFDNDGYKDIYITNGILGATNDMDFINFISDEKIQKRLGTNMTNKDLELINDIPSKKVSNYFFKNNGDNTFIDVTKKWSTTIKSFSNGGAYADFDNDGDLDIVVNNINENAFIIRNNSEVFYPNNNFLKFILKGSDKNKSGIGSKIFVYSGKKKIYYENFTTKGYLSSVSPVINVGVANNAIIDSVKIIWPDGNYQTKYKVLSDTLIVFDYELSKPKTRLKQNRKNLFKNVPSPINFEHRDKTSIEFNRDPLVPYASTNKGPYVSVSDINNDGLDDLLISGAKAQKTKLFIQNKNGEFEHDNIDYFTFDQEAIKEATSHLFVDINNDGSKDLIIVYGGNEFRSGKSLQPDLYVNKNSRFELDSLQFKNVHVNASSIKSVDFDNDGDLDIFIMSDLVPWEFGVSPKQYFFLNDGFGKFTDASSLLGDDFINAGNVEDIIWVDVNSDGYKDAILAGKWMPIKLFLNKNGKTLVLQNNNNLEKTNGWWNSIQAVDFDKDGDVDIIAGNWGLNTRLKASLDEPITLYNYDFDNNGKTDPIVTYFYKGIETPFSSKDELAKQLPYLNKTFLSYGDFASASLSELFSKKKLNKSLKKHVYLLSSSYFENQGDNSFKIYELPFKAQISSVNDIFIDDFNGDGFFDVFLIGNDYEISTQLGKLDASHGCILLNDKKGYFIALENQNFDVSGPARYMKSITINKQTHYIISINNDAPIFLKKND